MTRGNQREQARVKNQKKQSAIQKQKASGEKGANKGQSLEARKQRDADIMRDKQAKKMAAKEGAAGGATGGSS